MYQLQKLIRRYEIDAKVSLPNLNELYESTKERRYKAKSSIFMEGDLTRAIFVVRVGLVKQFVINETGAQWIRSFSTEGCVFGCSNAFQIGSAATFSSSAIEYSVLEEVDWRVVESLSERFEQWNDAKKYVINQFLLSRTRRAEELLMLRPDERYKRYLKSFPSLLARVPQKELASFFGVTTVGMNRIVKRHSFTYECDDHL